MLWLQKKPRLDGISDAVWKRLVAHWSDSMVKKKANQNSKNRRSEPAGPNTGISKHRGGSRAAVDHAIAIEKKTNALASKWSIFCTIHPEGDGSYTYGVTKKIAEEILAKEVRGKASLNDDDTQEIDMDQLSMDTTVKKEGRVLGIGNMAQTRPLHTDSSASYVSLATRDEMQQRFEEVKQREIVMEEKLQVLLSKMHEVDEMRNKLNVLLEMVGRGQMCRSCCSS